MSETEIRYLKNLDLTCGGVEPSGFPVDECLYLNAKRDSLFSSVLFRRELCTDAIYL